MNKKKPRSLSKIEERVLKRVEEDLQELLQRRDGAEARAIIEEELKKQNEIFKENKGNSDL